MENTKRFILAMDPEVHKQVKILSMLQGTTMTDFMNEAIQEKLERERGGHELAAAAEK
jgi:hypothetical protein